MAKVSMHLAAALAGVIASGCGELTNDNAAKSAGGDGAESAAYDPEGGVAYDVATGAVHAVSAAPGEKPAATEGSGALADVTSFTPAELDQFAEVEAAVAPYEEAGGQKDADGTFIPFSVIEPDERVVVVDTTVRPARSIVQILFRETEGGAVFGCTGSLIAPNVVLTAGHCVITAGVWHTDFAVYPGRNGGVQPFGSCKAKGLYSVQGYIAPLAGAVDDRYYDIGGIKLDCNVGDQTGWFAMSAVAEGAVQAKTTVTGYPCDKAPAWKQWVSADEIRALRDLKVFYQNDTFGCQSGGPVFLGDDRETVYAVHTNGLHGGEPWSSNNAATRLTETRIKALTAWLKE